VTKAYHRELLATAVAIDPAKGEKTAPPDASAEPQSATGCNHIMRGLGAHIRNNGRARPRFPEDGNFSSIVRKEMPLADGFSLLVFRIFNTLFHLLILWF
jgi:hypothetical protein